MSIFGKAFFQLWCNPMEDEALKTYWWFQTALLSTHVCNYFLLATIDFYTWIIFVSYSCLDVRASSSVWRDVYFACGVFFFIGSCSLASHQLCN